MKLLYILFFSSLMAMSQHQSIASSIVNQLGTGSSSGGGTNIVLNTRKAFPDAWGEGANVVEGGRGGIKFFITSLADTNTATYVSSGGEAPYYTGTFRGAILLGQDREIIPRIAGRVELGSDLTVSSGSSRWDMTYHGHLAPTGGLYITNYQVYINRMEQWVFRYLRLRVGADEVNTSTYVGDVLSWIGTRNTIVDHCSLGWGFDEGLSSNNNGDNYINNIWSYNLLHQNIQGHNTGSLIGYTNGGALAGKNTVHDVHNNVYVGVTHRVPNFAGDNGSEGRIYNNITYGWNGRLTTLIGAPSVDVSYNYYKRSPDFSHNARYVNKWESVPDYTASPVEPAPAGDLPYPPSIWSEGNIYPGYITSATADNKTLWRDYFADTNQLPSGWFRSSAMSISSTVGYQPTSAQDAYDRLVIGGEVGANRTTSSAGVAVVARDIIDTWYINSIKNNTTAYRTLANWTHPSITAGTAYTDSDWNGIADSFETAHGISLSTDVITSWDFGTYTVTNNAGYTAFEIWSAYIAGDFERILENQ